MLRSLMAVLILCTAATAQAKKYPWAQYDIRFPQAGAAKPTWESHTGMCDDSYYGGLTVTVPGRLGVNFTVEKPQWDGECVIENVRFLENQETGAVKTRFFIRGQCDSQLIFRLIEAPKRHAVMDLNSAC